jgi:hypothetical protein
VPPGGANGVLVTQGPVLGLGPVSQGRQADLHDEPARHRAAEVGRARRRCRPASIRIVFDWKMDPTGEPLARGGNGTLSVDGQQVAQRSWPRTQPLIWAWGETFDIGLDTGTSVDDKDYCVDGSRLQQVGGPRLAAGSRRFGPASENGPYVRVPTPEVRPAPSRVCRAPASGTAFMSLTLGTGDRRRRPLVLAIPDRPHTRRVFWYRAVS